MKEISVEVILGKKKKPWTNYNKGNLTHYKLLASVLQLVEAKLSETVLLQVERERKCRCTFDVSKRFIYHTV